ncbi:hypothetical protein QJS04_geneDACA022482 [Acorus gramineus]|uniref:Dynein light chain n=1 Tax=Acorus gramineus TaxID=55184 RepID=A0AAV9BI31_ACOGR|nr:hypothetical protein QJS04_geneDACA022482 [Acorus gramineus]
MEEKDRRLARRPPLRRTRSASAPAPAIDELHLAAIAAGLNIRPRSADMAPAMQEKAFRFARRIVDSAGDRRPSPTQIALALKKEFDSSYGLAWHCVVGKSFGSFLTHSPGGFVYFSLDGLSLLLFKTEVRPVAAK